MGVTRDLYTFLLGYYSLDTSIQDRPGRTPPLHQKEHTFSNEPRISSGGDTQPPVHHLVDELMKSHETSDILASRDRLFDSN
ncbi:MAG: hypothetical protein LQ345_006877, partial [Seirophora villosa]